MPHTEYRLKSGAMVPSVTTVMSKFKDPGPLQYWSWQQGKEGKDFRESMQKAADIGSAAHARVEAFIKQKPFDPAGMDPAVVEASLKPWAAFQEWADGTKFQPVESELPLVSERHRFGGCMDMSLFRGKLALGDLKSSKDIYPEYWVQLAGYRILYEENFPDKPLEGGLHILRIGKQDGEFDHSWRAIDSPVAKAATEMFLALREAYRCRQILYGKDEWS